MEIVVSIVFGSLSVLLGFLAFFFARGLSKRTDALIATEDARAKQMIDNGNKRTQEMLKGTQEMIEQGNKRAEEADRRAREMMEQGNKRAEEADRRTREMMEQGNKRAEEADRRTQEMIDEGRREFRELIERMDERSARIEGRLGLMVKENPGEYKTGGR